MRYDTTLPDGRQFSSDGEPTYPTGLPHLDDLGSEREVVSFCHDLWERTLRARLPELERLRMCELAYSGFHYRLPEHNRTLEVTNHCRAAVEALVPALIENRPRPEFMGRRSMDDALATRIQETADWWQDIAGADQTRRLAARAKAKCGYALIMLSTDYETGIPFPTYWSPANWYPDGSASHLRDCEFHFLAAPIQTRRLKMMFPDKADVIRPDNFVSPEWESTVLPRIENYVGIGARRSTAYGTSVIAPDATFPYNQGSASGSSAFVFAPYTDATHTGTDTTLFVQLLIRDYGSRPAVFPGNYQVPANGDLPETSIPGFEEARVPCCPSGWRILQLTGYGDLLRQTPLDECYLGLPFVIDYLIEHEGRIEGVGLIDDIWPMNRSYNERKNLLNRALRLEAAPVLKASKGHGIRFDQSGISAGDVLEPTRGSDVSWLDYAGPSQHQFAHLEVERRDIQLVGGIPEILYGQRPTGVEAAAAFRELGSRADVRTRGMMLPALDAWALLTVKALHIMSKKMKVPLLFKATGGDTISVSGDDLAALFKVKWGEGSGTVENRRDMEEKYLGLYDRGLMTPDLVLKALHIPDWENVARRIAMLSLLKEQAAAGPQAAPERAAKGGPA